jgi:hypothetical protein
MTQGGLVQRIDAILKASGAKGISHNGRMGVCRLLCLGEPTSKTDAKRKLRAFLARFDDTREKENRA